jgi:anti-anti-sigma factor
MALGPAVKHEDMRHREGHAQAMLGAVEFRVDVALEHDTIRVRPLGELDVATIGTLRERVYEAMKAGTRRLILDLRETTFVDSSGLHLAVETYEWALGNGAEFAIIPAPPHVQRTFDVAGLTTRLPFVDVPRA